MKAPGNFVGVIVEFSACMQFSHDDFCGGPSFLIVRVDFRGNSATVVGDTYGIVGVNDHRNFVAISGECLVDSIVNDLKDHMMQTGAITRVTYIHPGALAYGLQAF